MKTKKEKEIIYFKIRSNRTNYEKSRRLYIKTPKKQIRNKNFISQTLSLILKKNNIKKSKKKFRKSIYVNIPKVFSFYKDSNIAWNTIKFLLYKYNSNQFEQIVLNYKRLKYYDIVAETILDFIIYNIKEEKKKKSTNFSICGELPDDKQTSRFIRGIGIIETLNIEHNALKDNELDEIKIFKSSSIKNNNESGVTKSFLDKIAIDFLKYINKCLKPIGYTLTKDNSRELINSVSEILHNIKDHSGMNEWFFYGYLDTNYKDNLYCEIAIINFGNTFAESFNSEDIMPNEMIEYIKLHKNYASEEALKTIFALQGNVSSKNFSDEDTRGQGTIELISFFQNLSFKLQKNELCDTHCNMLLISGKTIIIFDSSCKLSNNQGRKIIAFNKENQLNYPPEKKFIKNEKIFFPGTAIGLKFPLPKSMITESNNAR